MDNANATKTSGTYEVHESQVEWLKGKLEKLNRRAAKLNVPGVTLTWTGEKIVPVLDRDDLPTGEVNRYLIAQVEGTTPKLAGWTFVATLQHADEAGTVIRSVPGYAGQIPLEYRTASRFSCDHCKSVRTRKDTYLVQNEAGEFKQVGGNCLAGFLGGGLDPHQAAAWANWAFSVNEALTSGGGSSLNDARLDLGVWLAHVAAVIRVTGRWISKAAARKYSEASGGVAHLASTSETASATLYARTAEERAATAEFRPQAEDFTFGEAALEWTKEVFHSKDAASRSDFEHNLVVATASEALQTRSTGIAAAAVGLYKKHLDGEVARKAREEAGKASLHFGEIGARLVFHAKALAAPKALEGNFGTTYLYKLITTEGNLVTWFASNELEELEFKDNAAFVALIGTVKKHDEFRGEKQTVVSRVAIPTQKQLDKATGADKVKKALAKAAKKVETRFEQLNNEDW